MPHAEVRQAARALLVALGPSVLLIGGRDPTRPEAQEFWVAPGGGLAAHEAPEEAARREPWEEMGLRLTNLGPLTWVRHVDFVLAGRHCSQDEYFYVVRHERFHPSPAQLTGDEESWVTTVKWWALEQIEALDLTVHRHRLVPLLRDWLRVSMAS